MATRTVAAAAGGHHDDHQQHYDEGDDHEHLHPAPSRVRLGVRVAGRVSHFRFFSSWVVVGGQFTRQSVYVKSSMT
jgi:hypothetical protein